MTFGRSGGPRWGGPARLSSTSEVEHVHGRSDTPRPGLALPTVVGPQVDSDFGDTQGATHNVWVRSAASRVAARPTQQAIGRRTSSAHSDRSFASPLRSQLCRQSRRARHLTAPAGTRNRGLRCPRRGPSRRLRLWRHERSDLRDLQSDTVAARPAVRHGRRATCSTSSQAHPVAARTGRRVRPGRRGRAAPHGAGRGRSGSRGSRRRRH
ncbi:hypothetical protein ABIB15_001091 [Marisediminicola sp. UYEF4]